MITKPKKKIEIAAPARNTFKKLNVTHAKGLREGIEKLIDFREIPRNIEEARRGFLLVQSIKRIFDEIEHFSDPRQINFLQELMQEAGNRLEVLNEGLRLPEPNDGSYLTYGEYLQVCRADNTPVKDRLSGQEFLREHWHSYLDAGVLFLPELRKLDKKLVDKLDRECKSKGKTTSDLVPNVSKKRRIYIGRITKEDLLRSYKILHTARTEGFSLDN